MSLKTGFLVLRLILKLTCKRKTYVSWKFFEGVEHIKSVEVHNTCSTRVIATVHSSRNKV